MAQSRFYSANAQPTVLTSSITPSQTTVNVQQDVGFPSSVPFIIAIDYNTSSEEVCLVTARAGTNFTVTRAYDGTSGTSHNAGAAVRHTWSAVDGTDSRAHEGSASGVHGVAGPLVGTTDAQVLTNKSLTSPTITGTVAGGASYTGPTVTNPTVTGTVAGGASYTAPTITGNVAGNPRFTAGVEAGSSGQFKVDVNGRPSSTTLASAAAEDTTTRTTTNTSFEDTTLLSVSVTVPPSGKVYVSGALRHGLTASGVYGYSSFTATGSTSGVIQSASQSRSAQTGYPSLTADGSDHLSMIFTSTNPGETLTVKWQHSIGSAGPTYNLYYRNLSAIPLLG